MGRSPCCPKEGVNRGAWSAQEDEILTSYIKTHGEGKWRDLPKRAGLRRCGKSCRLRWLNYLRPDIKRGNISSEEEDLIIRLHNLLGNRWSLIAGRLPGRTDNEIKNYWNTCLGKRMRAQPTIEDDLEKKKQSIDNSSEHEPHEQRMATSCTEQDTEMGLPAIPSLLSRPENNHDLNFLMDFDLDGQSGPADMLDYYNYLPFFGDDTDHVIDSTSFDHHLQFSEAELDNWKVGNLISWSSKC